MPGPTPYLYKPEDSPLTVANQFGITPNQLLTANPGGYPFSQGQQINIPAANPYQYSAPIGPQPPTLLQQRMAQPVTTPPVSRLGTPYGPNYRAQPSINPPPSGAYGTDDSWYAPAAPAAGTTPQTPGGTTSPVAPTLAGGDFYGYERDPETGRSVRVIKNSASSNFLNELRWDPQRRRYVSIGRLLKQGKLDLKGNWRKQSNRQRRNAAIERKQQIQTQKDDFTLSNSLISFSASSG